jgi:hypothetical protein
MSTKGRLLQNGVSVGGDKTRQLAHAKSGLLTQGPSNGPWGKAPGPFVDPAAAIRFHEDFFEINKNDSDEVGWLVTAIQGTNTFVVANLNGYGGEARLGSGATSGDGDYIQWHHTIASPVLTTGKLWFTAKVAIGAVAAMFQVGLSNVLAGDPFVAGITDGIYFTHGSTNVLSMNTEDAAVTSEDTGITMAINTYYELGFLWDGPNARVDFFVDNVRVGRHSTIANIPTNVDLVPFMAIKTAAAVARTVYFDWVSFIQSRLGY